MEKKSITYLTLLVTIFVFFVFIKSPLLKKGEDGPLALTKVRAYDGQIWRLDKFKNKPMVINFWATWCSVCIKEMPSLSLISRKYPQVIFVGLAVDSPALDVALAVKQFDIGYPIAAADYSILEMWKAYSLPTTYVLNEKGQIVASQLGLIDFSGLEKILVELIGIEPTTS